MRLADMSSVTLAVIGDRDPDHVTPASVAALLRALLSAAR
jgi:hypothetical protein